MSKHIKIWLVAAILLLVLGCILFIGTMSVLKWDFAALSTSKYETNTYEITESISAISIHTNTADIRFIASEDATCTVICYEQKNVTHTVTAQDGTLSIEVVDARKWYEHIGFHFKSPSITVYIPEGDYGALSITSDTGDVEIPKDFHFASIDISEDTGNVTNYASAAEAIKIKTSTGDICVKNVSAGSLDLTASTGDMTVSGVTCEGDVSVDVSTGKVYLTDITCKNVTSDGSTGNISLKNVIAEEKISIERSTGDVNFERSDAAEIFVETDTGEVEGSLCSEKVFVVNTDTGDIDVPNSITGGRCEITTDTGDIKITIH